MCVSTLADPNNTILVGIYVCSRSHGCGEGQRVGKGKYILDSLIGVKCHDLLGAYRTSKPHVAQIIKKRCVGSQHTFVFPSQFVCLRGTQEESQTALKGIQATEHLQLYSMHLLRQHEAIAVENRHIPSHSGGISFPCFLLA